VGVGVGVDWFEFTRYVLANTAPTTIAITTMPIMILLIVFVLLSLGFAFIDKRGNIAAQHRIQSTS
jgi:hypothetical protein